jgi:hypothetical protein
MNDGLPQGSVLAPTLFNLYMSDLPKTEGTVFQFADDIAIVYQSLEMVDGERVLTKNLTTLNTYFQRWRLKLNPNKTDVCVFHLNNKQAGKTLDIILDNVQLNHNFTPKYLGITLDRTLSFKKQIENSAKKVKSRVNLIRKLAGTG